MRKLMFGLVALIMVSGLLLAGCLPQSTADNTAPNSSTPTIPMENTPSNSTMVLDNPPPENVTWVSPGKVNVSNFYPGARAEYPVTIHNGNNVATEFLISYRNPDNVATGYSRPSSKVQDWVIVADETPVLAPKETREVMVILEMPKDAKVFAESWEFWISVKDNSQTGTVKTELCIRWLIDMRSG
jgi:hypothetical protein